MVGIIESYARSRADPLPRVLLQSATAGSGQRRQSATHRIRCNDS